MAAGLSIHNNTAIGFAYGQAGFAFLVISLFDLVSPTGAPRGVPIENVCLGAAIGFLTAALVWRRSAAAATDLIAAASSYLEADTGSETTSLPPPSS